MNQLLFCLYSNIAVFIVSGAVCHPVLAPKSFKMHVTYVSALPAAASTRKTGDGFYCEGATGNAVIIIKNVSK